MAKYKDITGQRFGMLTAIEVCKEMPKVNNGMNWTCLCDCGVKVAATQRQLKRGHATSCGCTPRPRKAPKQMTKRIGDTICWNCKNAVPSEETGCSWSRKFEPVKGWTATPTKIEGEMDSFHIEKCPEFVREQRRRER